MARAVDLVVVGWLWLVHTVGLYAAWSRVWRWLDARRHRWPIPPPLPPDELSRKITKATSLWTPDRWWRLFDTVSAPGRLEARILDPQSMTHSVDCDEYAVDAIASLGAHRAQHGELGPDGERLGDALLLQVVWRRAGDPWWRVHGHHVCAFRWLPPARLRRELGVHDINGINQARWDAGRLWWHLSNWGLFGPADHVAELAELVVMPDRPLCAVTLDPATLRVSRRLR